MELDDWYNRDYMLYNYVATCVYTWVTADIDGHVKADDLQLVIL